MVLGYSVSHLFQFPVEKVVKAHCKSYNERKDVLEVKQVENDNDVQGLEYFKWFITTLNPLPSIIRKMGRMDEPNIQIEEELWIDSPGRRHWLRQQNVSFTDNMTIQRNSTFVPDSHNPEWTCFEQAGAVDMGNLGFIGKALELLYKNVMETDVRQQIALIEGILDNK
ncbi:PRELI domain-containing protein 2-like [Thrips palmi]|uniref:PRELI domain-containing protein 2-like n=1 Tax=Thrips palmi TaxID=161013 RepID=A0A6P9AHE3_THRPL|nr:PRELI domain-containing protein 2-like [Thrips palmi]